MEESEDPSRLPKPTKEPLLLPEHCPVEASPQAKDSKNKKLATLIKDILFIWVPVAETTSKIWIFIKGEFREVKKGWHLFAVILVIACGFTFWFGKSYPMLINGLSKMFIRSTTWQPRELPNGSTNITVWFGKQRIEVPKWMAEMKHAESDTNTYGTNYFSEALTSNLVLTVHDNGGNTNNAGTRFNIKDLPSFFARDSEKMPGFSRRKRSADLESEFFKTDIGGKSINCPVWPIVISNRLFVDVEIPFINKRHRIMMNTNLEDELSGLPKLWDINYNATKFEIVNEDTNPVLQVIYESPKEVKVNGIYLLDACDLYWAFDTDPELLETAKQIR